MYPWKPFMGLQCGEREREGIVVRLMLSSQIFFHLDKRCAHLQRVKWGEWISNNKVYVRIEWESSSWRTPFGFCRFLLATSINECVLVLPLYVGYSAWHCNIKKKLNQSYNLSKGLHPYVNKSPVLIWIEIQHNTGVARTLRVFP